MVEVQLRTALQHAWATSLEAVGLVRGEDLKAGEGDQRWLRFFELMSGELAAREGCAVPSSVAIDLNERRRELREVTQDLKAVETLDGYRRAIHATSSISASGHGGMFLIQYDPASLSVSVDRTLRLASDAYGQSERVNGAVETVLVEVDRVGDLRTAYPNYYLDVGDFLNALRDALWGVPIVDVHKLAEASPQTAEEVVKRLGGWRPDLSWLPDWRKR